ncbi:hypothetical protein [Streptomyces niveus]|uniref:hypothetical protein n=1 Tax=Streptomyces niveus TaxID=193462 RepID=UPI00344441A9
MTTAISSTATAALLAALLPARKGAAWQVGPAPQIIRAGAATARLVQGGRALDVVELNGRIEVYADRRGPALSPDVVVAATGSDPVAELTALVLRVVLPRLAREVARVTERDHGREQVVVETTEEMNEVAGALIAKGAHLEVVPRLDGVGMTWSTGDAEWGLWVLGGAGSPGNLSLTYEGPVSGLYGLLPVVLPSGGWQDSDGLGSVFTRHLTDRFPQLRTLNADEVTFGRRDDAGVYVALPSADESTDRTDDSRRVVAEVNGLGTDLLLTAVSHLV